VSKPNPACNAPLLVSLTLALNVFACTDATYGAADLPAGWEGAERVERFAQSECEAEAFNGAPEAIATGAADGAVDIQYEHAPFRCEQDVEAFVRKGQAQLDVLVQPINMNPPSTARCDCTYLLGMTLPPRSGRYDPGEYELTVYRRWDHINTENDLVEVGVARLDLQ
jgi:hypothetical protein